MISHRLEPRQHSGLPHVLNYAGRCCSKQMFVQESNRCWASNSR